MVLLVYLHRGNRELLLESAVLRPKLVNLLFLLSNLRTHGILIPGLLFLQLKELLLQLLEVLNRILCLLVHLLPRFLLSRRSVVHQSSILSSPLPIQALLLVRNLLVQFPLLPLEFDD